MTRLGCFLLALVSCTRGANDASQGDAVLAPGAGDPSFEGHLTLSPGGEGDAYALRFSDALPTAPRIMELFLKHAGFTFLRAEKGEATKAAEKELIAQEQEDGSLRTIIFSSANLNTLSVGTLATYYFERTPGASEARLELQTDNQIFAPREANEGLVVQDPITVRFE